MHRKKQKRTKLTMGQRIRYHFVSCANICSIHGVAHIVRKNISPFERLLWILLVTSATAWCIELGLQAWNRYQTRPTVISLERDHWKWNTTFPGVTLCLNEIDNEKAETLISNLNISNETNYDEFKNFLTALANADFSLMEFDKYINNSLYQDVEKYLDWVLQASPTLDYPVETEQTFGELHEFETILTEFGLCFAYNSRIAIYSTPEYLAKRTNKLVNTKHTILMINPSIPTPTLSIRSLASGYQVIFSGRIFFYTIVKIFFHGPNEIPEMSTKGMLIPPATFTYFELLIESVSTPPEVSNLKISQRNCRLSEESNLKHSPIYSYNLCRAECRRHISFELCNCLPYFYFPREQRNICNTSGMQCLNNHKCNEIIVFDYSNPKNVLSDLITHLKDESNQIKCSCIQNCDTDSITISKYEIIDWFLGTNVQWKVTQYPTLRYKRSLIFSNISMLVQIGGVAGLFLGCTILSIIELFYYFTMRFYWGVIKGRTIQ